MSQELKEQFSMSVHNFSITTSQSLILIIESIELHLPTEADLFMKMLSGASMLLVALFNGYLLYFVFQQNKKTFLDWMIVFDSILCVANCVTLAGGAKFRGSFKKNYLGVQKYVLFLSIFRQFTSTVLKILHFHTHTPHHSIFSFFFF